jgi:hypothetical protein
MHAIHLLLQRNPMMFWANWEYSMCAWTEAYYWGLSKHSPNWYKYKNGESDESESDESESDESELPPPPPFELLVIRVGSRLGWCWACTYSPGEVGESEYCEINWLDPEPRKGSIEYEAYIEELSNIHRLGVKIDFYSGYHQPPTKAEYHRLCERYWNENDRVMVMDDAEEMKELLSRKRETRFALKKKKSRSKKTRKRGKQTKQKNDPIIDTQPDFVVY